MDIDKFIEKDIKEFLELEFKKRKEKEEKHITPELQLLSIEERDYEKEFKLALEEGLNEKAKKIFLEVKNNLSKSTPGSYRYKYFQELYTKLFPLINESLSIIKEEREEEKKVDREIKHQEEENKPVEEDKDKGGEQLSKEKEELNKRSIKVLKDIQSIISEENIKNKKDIRNISHSIAAYAKLKDLLKKEKLSEEGRRNAEHILIDFFKSIKKMLQNEYEKKKKQEEYREQTLTDDRGASKDKYEGENEKDLMSEENDKKVLEDIKLLKSKMDFSIEQKDILTSMELYNKMKQKVFLIQDDKLRKELNSKFNLLFTLLKKLEATLKDLEGGEELIKREKRMKFHLP